MRAAARVGVLVQVRSVECGERPVVAREVGRDPVEDHADATFVEAVDELTEVVGRAEARGRRVVARHLVAPRTREGMLHHGQQLDVREPEVGDVVGKLVGELVVRQRTVSVQRVAAPRAEVDLVDRQRAAERIRGGAAFEPFLVAPDVFRVPDHRRVRGRHFGVEGKRVALETHAAVLRSDLELVFRAFIDAGNEQFPDPGRAEGAHRMQAAIPGVEVAHHGDRARVRRPDGKGGTDHAVEIAYVRA
jgi:hypothetical protein